MLLFGWMEEWKESGKRKDRKEGWNDK